MKYLFLFIVTICSNIYSQENIRYINVNGTSELILAADQITITVQLKTVDESIAESKQNNDKQLSELLSVLKNFIPETDIEVSPLSLGKNYEFTERERKQKGFFTEIKVTCLLRKIDNYYDLVNKLSAFDYLEITGSTYGISDYEKQHRISYEKALQAAKEKAEYMTNAMGRKPGDILEIEEYNYMQSYPNPYNVATVESSGNLSGKVTIRRSVRVKFSIM